MALVARFIAIGAARYRARGARDRGLRVVAWVKSPLRAKEILIKLFTVITIVLSVAFGLASLYAFFEHNVKVLEITGTFLVVSLVALGITRICRWRFVKRHPQYKNKAMPTKYL